MGAIFIIALLLDDAGMMTAKRHASRLGELSNAVMTKLFLAGPLRNRSLYLVAIW